MICSQCERDLSRSRQRCHECGACEVCCDCEKGPDKEGFDADTGTFDRDELGSDPEED